MAAVDSMEAVDSTVVVADSMAVAEAFMAEAEAFMEEVDSMEEVGSTADTTATEADTTDTEVDTAVAGAMEGGDIMAGDTATDGVAGADIGATRTMAGGSGLAGDGIHGGTDIHTLGMGTMRRITGIRTTMPIRTRGTTIMTTMRRLLASSDDITSVIVTATAMTRMIRRMSVGRDRWFMA